MGLGTERLNSEAQTNSSQDQQNAQQNLNPTTARYTDEQPILRMMDNSSEFSENQKSGSDTEQTKNFYQR